MKSVENEECGECGVWKLWNVENKGCVENAEDLMIQQQ